MQYDLKVISNSRDVSVLSLNASSSAEAALEAKRQGFIVLSVKEKSKNISRLVKRGASFPLLLFSHELLSLLKAGLSLIDAMETLREKEHRIDSKRVLDRIMESLYEGLPLSNSLEKIEGVFPPLYIALIRSSEKTGDLPEALQRYVEYQIQVDLIRKKVISASIYPAILMVVGGLVVVFLLFYVVPKFSVIYENQGDQLPWLSMLLLTWGKMLYQHLQAVLIAIAATGILLLYLITREHVRKWIVNFLLRIPALGERMRIYQLSRFYRTMGMLLRGGISVTSAMQMVSGLLQLGLRSQLAQAQSDVREGIALSSAMEKRKLTTPVAVRMMRVGEHTGQMGEMMEHIGNFYDEEVARWVDWFIRLFEPILMIFIGLFIGAIVVLMYMPIFELAGSLQ